MKPDTNRLNRLVGKRVRVTLGDRALAPGSKEQPKRSLRERLARVLFLLEQKYWDGWLKQHNTVSGALGNVRITYRARTWEKLAPQHRRHYYYLADEVIDIMKGDGV